jgi:hypothetical protein
MQGLCQTSSVRRAAAAKMGKGLRRGGESFPADLYIGMRHLNMESLVLETGGLPPSH